MTVSVTKPDVNSGPFVIAGSKALSFGEGLGEVKHVFNRIFTTCSSTRSSMPE